MKSIALCGIGNGITDILVTVDDRLFRSFGLKAGSMQLVSAEEQTQLLAALGEQETRLVSGGAVCNSIIIAQQLGAQTSFICRFGDDHYGLHYQEELQDLGIEVPNSPIVRGRSGTSVIMVTPDGERTMSTCLHSSADLVAEDVSAEAIRRAEWIFIEGYLLGNGEAGQQAVLKAIEYAKQFSTKIALTFAAEFVVDVFRPLVREILPQIDLVFANHQEANTFAQRETLSESIELISSLVPHLAVTEGAEGVHISHGAERLHVPAFPCTPIDLTGAGDAFAGGYLYGISQKLDLKKSAHAACYLAMQVITRRGARLQSGTREYWSKALADS